VTAPPFDLVAIGASLGGLAALSTVLGALPEGFPAAVAVVQHRRAGEDSLLAEILARATRLPVREPMDKEPATPGTVYLAPADYHLLVEDGSFALSTEAAVAYARPSIDVLFESAAHAYGRRLVAVLLTASSEDGAAGIAAAAERGGYTVVEDPASAASPIAPLAALRRTRVRRVLPLAEIGPHLAALVAPATVGR
jgi:two-component system chemotaxis response regulator CheB